MEHIRKKSYVARELRRRRMERRQRIISKVVNALACIALVIGTEAFMFALFLV